MPSRQIVTLIGLVAVILYFILDSSFVRERLAGREDWLKKILLVLAGACLIYSAYMMITTGGS